MTTPRDLSSYFPTLFQRKFAPGQTIFLKGDPPDGIHTVRSGCVRLSVTSDEGKELSFDLAHAGNVFGEVSVLDGYARSASATALTAVETAFIPAGDIKNKLIEDPALGLALIELLCNRIRQVSAQFEGLAHYPIEARLARYLLGLVRDRGSDCIDLGVSQSELGFLLGATRQHVNRALGNLEEAGALLREKGIYRCDSTQLRKISGS